MAKSNTNCSVVGCNNTYKNCPEGTKFYSFPSSKTFATQRKCWISALNRKNKDGSAWIPSSSSKICSQHFVNGVVNREPQNPGYIPTLMPECYKLKTKITDAVVKRSQRALIRRKKQEAALIQMDIDDDIINTSEIAVQCGLSVQSTTNTDHPDIFFLNREGNCVETYCDLPLKQTKVTVNASVGTGVDPCSVCKGDIKHQEAFSGYCSINSDDKMRELTGVSTTTFTVLLALLTCAANVKVSKENRLVIFLMKMKHGIHFSALGCLFGIHRTTVSKIFFKTLKYLCENTSNWIYWPSRKAVQDTMPKCFLQDYHNVRAIIDCTEIKLEQPPTVDQSIYFFSTYKSGFTVKFLVAVSPNGYISFVSHCYGGRATDGYITTDSGFLDLLGPGDVILADKGFPQIKCELEKKNTILVMPPFATGGQFSSSDIDDTFKVASVRVYVERVIQRIKLSEILNKITMELLPHVDEVVHMTCIIANLLPPVINDLK